MLADAAAMLLHTQLTAHARVPLTPQRLPIIAPSASWVSGAQGRRAQRVTLPTAGTALVRAASRQGCIAGFAAPASARCTASPGLTLVLLAGREGERDGLDWVGRGRGQRVGGAGAADSAGVLEAGSCQRPGAGRHTGAGHQVHGRRAVGGSTAAAASQRLQGALQLRLLGNWACARLGPALRTHLSHQCWRGNRR